MRILQIGVLILAVSLVSCKKAELKKPTSVNFAFDLNKSFGQSSAVKIISGEINLGKFNITGDRIEGDDIAFTRSFSSGLLIDLNGSGEIKELDYDIPQGEYTHIRLDFSAKENSGAPSIMLEGSYKPSTGPNVAVRFEYFINHEFSIIGEDGDLSSTIVMDKNLGKKVTIELNPIYWFESLTTGQLDNANIDNGQGQNIMLINPTTNAELYTIVAARIGMNNKAEFK